MTDQQFFDARDLFHTVRTRHRRRAEHTMIHAGLWRSRFDLRRGVYLACQDGIVYTQCAGSMTCKANATVVAT